MDRQLSDLEATQLAYEDAIATRDYAAINRLRRARNWALDDADARLVDATPRAAFFAPPRRDRPGSGLARTLQSRRDA